MNTHGILFFFLLGIVCNAQLVQQRNHFRHLSKRDLQLLVKRDFFSDLGRAFTSFGNTVAQGVPQAANTAAAALGGGANIVKQSFDSGFNQDVMQREAANYGAMMDAHGKKTKDVFETTGQQMVADFTIAGNQFVLEMTQLGAAVSKELRPMWDAIVWVGRQAVEGIIRIGQKIGKWVWDHKAEIASIAIGILVGGLLGVGLSAIGVPPPLAGMIAGAVSAFIGNEVKQIIQAAEQGKLNGVSSFDDFLQQAGEHLKDDAIPVLMGGIGGLVGGGALAKYAGQGAKGLGKVILRMPGKAVLKTGKDMGKDLLLQNVLG